MSTHPELDLNSEVCFQTKSTRHEVQLPLKNSHFEMAKFRQYQYFIDAVAGFLKKIIGRFYISFCMRNRSDVI